MIGMCVSGCVCVCAFAQCYVHYDGSVLNRIHFQNFHFDKERKTMKPIIIFRDELFEGKENYCSLTDVVRCTVASNTMQLKQCNGITFTFLFF